MIPVLMITYNRLDYTKLAFDALLKSDAREICLVDNGSTDGTIEWLKSIVSERVSVAFNKTGPNTIAFAMNFFLQLTTADNEVAKVDNDTIVPIDFFSRMVQHLKVADIVQAKHPILKATHPGGFDEWVSTMPAKGALRFNHFVGGSGIVFKRRLVDKIPETDWVLGGWRQFQRDHPQLKKAFATDIEIKLLDTDETGGDYSHFPEYYKETKRL